MATSRSVFHLLAPALFAMAGLHAGCTAESPEPVVAIVEVSPESIDTGDDRADDVTIVVEYRDADADLGGGTAEVVDCRADGVVHTSVLPDIASQEAIDQGVAIEGILEIAVADVEDIAVDSAAPAACADLGVAAPSAGEVVFCVFLTDAAGNRSTGDCTDSLTLDTGS